MLGGAYAASGALTAKQKKEVKTITKVVLHMQGGKKGLIINSRNLCGAKSRANVEFAGHNGKQASSNPVMKAECGGTRKQKRHRG